MADRLEAHFHQRIPPSRGGQMQQVGFVKEVRTITISGVAARGAGSMKFSKRQKKKMANGDLIFENGKLYDLSLWKAIFFTGFWQWSEAVTWNGIGRE